MRKLGVIAICLVLMSAVLIGCTSEKDLEYKDIVLEESYVHTMIFSDICFDGSEVDAQRESMIKKMIDKNSVELIILNGNTVTGDNVKPLWQNVVTFMESFKIPWTVNLGEKDLTDDFGRKELKTMLSAAENSLYMRGPSYKDTDYALRLVDNDGVLKSLVFLFDTSVKMSADRVTWYENTLKSQSKKHSNTIGNLVPSVALFNQPIPSFKEARDINNARQPLTTIEDDAGLFKKISKLGSTRTLIAGYDVKSSWYETHNNIKYWVSNSMYFTDNKIDYGSNGNGASMLYLNGSSATLSIGKILCQNYQG